MRRTDHDGHIARQGPPPFRVLAVPDNMYLSPTPPVAAPPPPRAPEPYKVAPTSTSFSNRAHRRSSFVILAESRPASPESGDASLPTGRVSPFRGRGFKGPPPRSMSRPQSPEVSGDGRRRRVERRGEFSEFLSRASYEVLINFVKISQRCWDKILRFLILHWWNIFDS